MEKTRVGGAKDPYIGSVRFYKNMILLVLILLITVPTALTVYFWRLSAGLKRELSDCIGRYEAALTQVARPEEKKQSVEVVDCQQSYPDLYGTDLMPEPITYQQRYPDFYVTEPAPKAAAEPGIMYLTFDDGPSANTEEILSILREKDVKATFFVVTRGGEKAVSSMKQIVAEGHTLGMHSYTHDYYTIYDSVEAFLEDYYQLFCLIREEVGVTPSVFRFPGGSINGYNQGLYQEIIAEMLRQGFVYYDWNLSAEDAFYVSPSAEDILNNVLDSSNGRTRGIVLMHDSDQCKTTVEALPELIDGLREQGFIFQRIDRSVKPIIFSYKDKVSS